MGIVRYVAPPQGKFCLCFPPLWFTVGVGTVWRCDNCARVYELVGRGDERKPAGGWARIDREPTDRPNGGA